MEGVIPRDDSSDDSEGLVVHLGDLVGEDEVGAARRCRSRSASKRNSLVAPANDHSRARFWLELIFTVGDDPAKLLASRKDLTERGVHDCGGS